MPPDPVKTAPAPDAWFARWMRPRSMLVGFAAGLINALIGIGGGIIIVPGLMFIGRLNPKAAISTSLGAIMLLSVIALAMHLAFAHVHVSLAGAAALLVAGFVGAQIGGQILKLMSQRAVMIVFAGLTLFFSLHMLGMSAGWIPAVMPMHGPTPLWGYPVVGIASGLFSGMLGIGGGGLVILGLSMLFQTPVAGGIPLALMVNAVNALSGVLAQWRTGQIHWMEVARLVPAAAVGAGVGTYVALILPANALRVIFALFFLYMGLSILRRSRSQQR